MVCKAAIAVNCIKICHQQRVPTTKPHQLRSTDLIVHTGQGRKEWVICTQVGGKDTMVEIRVSSKVINLSKVGIFAGWVGV